jgi:hypothetical protein
VAAGITAAWLQCMLSNGRRPSLVDPIPVGFRVVKTVLDVVFRANRQARAALIGWRVVRSCGVDGHWPQVLRLGGCLGCERRARQSSVSADR